MAWQIYAIVTALLVGFVCLMIWPPGGRSGGDG